MKLRPQSANDYLRFFRIYLYRPIAYMLLILLLLGLYLLFHKDIQMLWYTMIDKNRAIPVYVYNDPSLAKYQGQVILKDKNGTLLYKGMFEDGACNGLGIVYDERGKRKYEGNLTANVMEDTNGVFYDQDGQKIYAGEVHNNVREGKGSAYDSDGTIRYEGEFGHDVYEGEGVEYDAHGNIDYEGQFVDGLRHGEGILYEEGTNTRRRYRGSFAFGLPQGDGIFYDTFGKAFFKGAAYEGHINYTSLLPGTLRDIEEQFLIPYDIYIYQGNTAIVFTGEKLAFLTKDPITMQEDEETKEWKLSDEIKKEDVVFDRIVMADRNIDDTNAAFNMEAILKTWQAKYVPHEETMVMDVDDVFALRLSENTKFQRQKTATSLVKKGSGIYELDYHQTMALSRRIIYPVENMEIVYGFPVYEKELLYTIMRHGSSVEADDIPIEVDKEEKK